MARRRSAPDRTSRRSCSTSRLSSLNVGFGGESNGGIYHSAYDTLNWYPKYSDGDFVYGRTLSQLTGTLLLRLADAPVLPFQFTDTADTLMRYVVGAREARRGRRRTPSVDLAPVRSGGRGPAARRGQDYEKAYCACRIVRHRRRCSAPKELRAAQQAAAAVRAQARQRRRAAAARLVQASDLRARLLHRLRRQDDAADPRGAGGRPARRGAGWRAHGSPRRSTRWPRRSTRPQRC